MTAPLLAVEPPLEPVMTLIDPDPEALPIGYGLPVGAGEAGDVVLPPVDADEPEPVARLLVEPARGMPELDSIDEIVLEEPTEYERLVIVAVEGSVDVSPELGVTLTEPVPLRTLVLTPEETGGGRMVPADAALVVELPYPENVALGVPGASAVMVTVAKRKLVPEPLIVAKEAPLEPTMYVELPADGNEVSTLTVVTAPAVIVTVGVKEEPPAEVPERAITLVEAFAADNALTE